GLNFFNGLTPATGLNGVWTLKIIDNHAGGSGKLDQWSLNFGSGKTAGGDVVVAQTHVLGPITSSGETGDLVNSIFPLQPAVSPDKGIGPGAVIASDNTLGSFSPYEGRLYVAYTDIIVGGGNPTDNTDIYLAVSDDGGQTWTTQGPVNDDQ